MKVQAIQRAYIYTLYNHIMHVHFETFKRCAVPFSLFQFIFFYVHYSRDHSNHVHRILLKFSTIYVIENFISWLRIERSQCMFDRMFSFATFPSYWRRFACIHPKMNQTKTFHCTQDSICKSNGAISWWRREKKTKQLTSALLWFHYWLQSSWECYLLRWPIHHNHFLSSITT